MPVDVTPLANAVQRLREGLARHQSDPADELLRDGLIKRFEFTYELSHNTLRRYLQETLPLADTAVRMELVRGGNERGLLRAEWPEWRHFRDIRTRTTHTCNADTAAEVVNEIPAFIDEAAYLCDELKRRQP